MTAHYQIRAILDLLMGTRRNGETNDQLVFKCFSLSYGTHELLSLTCTDLAMRPHYHDVNATEHLQTCISFQSKLPRKLIAFMNLLNNSRQFVEERFVDQTYGRGC